MVTTKLCGQNSLQRILLSLATQQDGEYEKRIVYYWHHKNQSVYFNEHIVINKVFAFKEFLVCFRLPLLHSLNEVTNFESFKPALAFRIFRHNRM